MAEIVKIIGLSLGSILAIFLLTKLMGYRQMSQMSMFDYVNGITIGSIAAEMATSLEENFTQPLTALIVYALAAVSLSSLSSKSMRVRRLVEGMPLVLLDQGELYMENLKKAKIDVNEFLVQCRVNGYFDVSDVETAILEGNGKISFLPKETKRPTTPKDFQLYPIQTHMAANVIIDGKIRRSNLKKTGRDESWLLTQIHDQGAKNVKDVLLAVCDVDGKVTVFCKERKNRKKDSNCLE
jgi:uncharacterized membrane protein YcaP (DUF421 family)